MITDTLEKENCLQHKVVVDYEPCGGTKKDRRMRDFAALGGVVWGLVVRDGLRIVKIEYRDHGLFYTEPDGKEVYRTEFTITTLPQDDGVEQ